jgi:hypothetical protein
MLPQIRAKAAGATVAIGKLTAEKLSAFSGRQSASLDR